MKSFFAVPQKSTITEDIKTLIKLAPETAWVPYYNFAALPIPHSTLYQDPFFQKLAKRHEFHAGVLRLPTNTCYNWHIDTDRAVSINMLVEDDGRSQCLFLDGKPGVSFKFDELKYEPDTYYVLNTKMPHIVLNYSAPRYLFSVEFLGESRGLTFIELQVVFEE